jgi:hypothetical protein
MPQHTIQHWGSSAQFPPYRTFGLMEIFLHEERRKLLRSGNSKMSFETRRRNTKEEGQARHKVELGQKVEGLLSLKMLHSKSRAAPSRDKSRIICHRSPLYSSSPALWRHGNSCKFSEAPLPGPCGAPNAPKRRRHGGEGHHNPLPNPHLSQATTDLKAPLKLFHRCTPDFK